MFVVFLFLVGVCLCLKCVFSNALCGCVRPDVSPSDWLQLVQSGQHASQPGPRDPSTWRFKVSLENGRG